MKMSKDEYKQVYARDRTVWRNWLEKNHKSSEGVWLLYYKKGSNKKTVVYEEAVQEALCFGWIDSVINRVDDISYKQLFSPRKPKSTWSESNKDRVKRLIKQGLMTEAGLEKIELAKKNGSWTSIDKIEQLIIPEDLKKALAADKEAKKNFINFSNSNKKISLYWINNVKREDLRKQRIDKIVELAAKNMTLIQYRQKKM
jgi:uncharacterized protein YdeI (YjbR/CyaY-like superfamily)